MSNESDRGGSQATASLLSEPQRHHLESVLRYVERILAAVERDLDSSPPSRALQAVHSDLEARESDSVRSGVARARQILSILAARFALRRESTDLRRSVISRLSLLAIDARSAASRGLAAFGSVDERVATALDPPIETLTQELQSMVRSLATERPPVAKR